MKTLLLPLWNAAGKLLTVPAILLNWFAWLDNVSVNQVLTVIISALVVVYWIGRIRNQKLEKQKLQLEIKKLNGTA